MWPHRGPNGGPRGPRLGFARRLWCRMGPNGAERRPSGAPWGPNGTQRGPNTAQRGPTAAQLGTAGPRGAQCGPNEARTGPGREGSQRCGARTGPNGAPAGPERAPCGAQRGPRSRPRCDAGARLLTGSLKGPRRPMGSSREPKCVRGPAPGPRVPWRAALCSPMARRSSFVPRPHSLRSHAARGNASKASAPPPQGLGTNLCSTCRVRRTPQPGRRDPAPPSSERPRAGPRAKRIGLPAPFCVTKFGVISLLFSPFRGTVAGNNKIGVVLGPVVSPGIILGPPPPPPYNATKCWRPSPTRLGSSLAVYRYLLSKEEPNALQAVG